MSKYKVYATSGERKFEVLGYSPWVKCRYQLKSITTGMVIHLKENQIDNIFVEEINETKDVI